MKKGDAFSLHCASHCPDTNKGKQSVFTWWRVEEEGRKRRRLSYTGAVLTEKAATLKTGGDYECKCGSDGPLCSHYVTGKLDGVFLWCDYHIKGKVSVCLFCVLMTV